MGQQEIASKGRRIGALCDKLDASLNRSDWGVDLTRTINKLRLPVESVIWEALNTYQTTLRKSSFTV